MSDESDYDVKRPLRDVIGTLLELVLPGSIHIRRSSRTGA
jgi:hypothetical protein